MEKHGNAIRLLRDVIKCEVRFQFMKKCSINTDLNVIKLERGTFLKPVDSQEQRFVFQPKDADIFLSSW